MSVKWLSDFDELLGDFSGDLSAPIAALRNGDNSNEIDRILRVLENITANLQKGCGFTVKGMRADCWGPRVPRRFYESGHVNANALTRVMTGEGATTLYLPDAREYRGQVAEIKDLGGNAGTNAITIKTVAGQKIDGQSSVLIDWDDGAYQIRSDGENWFRIGTHLIDHGGMNGLNDDDHPQYHNDARGDARYYTQSEVDALVRSVPKVAFLTADVEVSDTTTLQNTGLSVSDLIAGQWYAFEAVLLTAVTNGEEGGGLKIDFNGEDGDGNSANVDAIVYDAVLNHTDESSPTVKGKEISALGTTVEIWSDGSVTGPGNLSGQVIIHGHVQAPAESAGVVALQHALVAFEEGASATIKAGSWLKLTRQG